MTHLLVRMWSSRDLKENKRQQTDKHEHRGTDDVKLKEAGERRIEQPERQTLRRMEEAITDAI